MNLEGGCDCGPLTRMSEKTKAREEEKSHAFLNEKKNSLVES